MPVSAPAAISTNTTEPSPSATGPSGNCSPSASVRKSRFIGFSLEVLRITASIVCVLRDAPRLCRGAPQDDDGIIGGIEEDRHPEERRRRVSKDAQALSGRRGRGEEGPVPVV